MQIKIEKENNTAIGLLEFLPGVRIPVDYLLSIQITLYNIRIDIYYDFEKTILKMKMYGSIISMMQFRKIILANWPNSLKE